MMSNGGFVKRWIAGAFVFILSSGAFAVDAGEQNLQIKGSSTIFPICKAASARYYQQTQKIVLCEGGGSGNGLKFALSGGIGSVSRSLSSDEKSSGLFEFPIARDGLTFMLHKNNPVANLSTKQLKQIFSGEIKDWSEVDKKYSGKIILMGPNHDHGTFDSLVAFLDLKIKTKDTQGKPIEEIRVSKEYQGFQSHNETIFKSEASEKVIAAVPMGFWNTYLDSKKDRLHSIKVDAIEPSPQTVREGIYPANRILHFVWKGQLKPEARSFFDFIGSKEGQEILKEQGFVPLKGGGK